MATTIIPRPGVNVTGYPSTITVPSGNRRAVERALSRMADQLDGPQFVITDAGRQALGAAA